MRAVNLIPPEDRRGESAPLRSGGLAYVVVAVLAVGLAAVCAVTFVGKGIADREAEVAGLETEAAELQGRAQALSHFTSFQQLHDARVATVDQLARSRFDWERVLRELSLVVPRHIWLTSLSGSVAPDSGDSTSPLRASILGPALELSGCGRTHRDVARLIAAMEDIDGVTRVTATDAAKSESVAVAPTAAATDAPLTGDDCQTRSTISKFNLIAAFDGVVTTATPAPVAPVAPVTPEATPTSSGDVQDQQAEARGEVATAQRRADDAANLVPGG